MSVILDEVRVRPRSALKVPHSVEELAPADPLIAHSLARTALEAGQPATGLFARARALDEEVAARRGTTFAGGEDPYRKPREEEQDDAAPADDLDGTPDVDGSSGSGPADRP